MSPPEVWGPAVWTLFHTLAERVNENIYPAVANQLFNVIVKICKFLPCPECSTDASNFLAKVQVSTLKTKTDFKNFIYLFHNWVNVKKRKPLFNYANMNKYENYALIPVVNNFLAKYNTKGNMKLLSESFQRNLIQKDFKKWISNNIHIFTRPVKFLQPEEPVTKESILEEPVTKESILEEYVLEERVLEERVLEESILEERALEEPTAKKSNAKKNNSKKSNAKKNNSKEPIIEDVIEDIVENIPILEHESLMDDENM